MSAKKFLAGALSTLPAQIPNAFSFTNETNRSLDVLETSNTIAVTGLNPNQSVTIQVFESTFGDQAVRGATTSAAVSTATWYSGFTLTVPANGTIYIQARQRTSNTYYDEAFVTVQVGEVSTVWEVRTIDVDLTPTGVSDETVTQNSGSPPSGYYTFTLDSLGGLSPNADYTVVRRIDDADYQIAVGGSSLGSFTTNTTFKYLTTTSSGTCVIQVKGAIDGYYWLDLDWSFNLRSGYSGNNTTSTYYLDYRYLSPTSYSISPSASTSAAAGTAVVWTLTVTNIPSAFWNNSFSVSVDDRENDLTGTDEGISLTGSLGSYSSVRTQFNTGTSATFYVRAVAPSAGTTRFATLEIFFNTSTSRNQLISLSLTGT